MLFDDIKKAKISAMKAKDKNSVTALNSVINKGMLLIVEKRSKGQEMVDADVVALLQKTEKELLEERASFVKANRPETVQELDEQISALKAYMPTLLTEEEVKDIIANLEDKTLPAIMAHFKKNYAGKCNMGMVSTLARQQ